MSDCSERDIEFSASLYFIVFLVEQTVLNGQFHTHLKGASLLLGSEEDNKLKELINLFGTNKKYQLSSHIDQPI